MILLQLNVMIIRFFSFLPISIIASISKPASLIADIKTLEYTHVIWRHGDRSPSSVFDNSDIYKWPIGLGELTKTGIEQQFRLGQWLRSRYGEWLGGNFDRKMIYIRSSDYNRTLMSALANIAGFFPPEKAMEPNINWQPIPVHTIPRSIDKELNEDIECPVAALELENQFKSKKVLEIREKYKTELKIFEEKLLGGQELQMRKVWLVYDKFFCEKCNNITWPNWMNYSIFEKLEKMTNELSKLEYHTEKLRRLRGGTLLEEIFNRFQAKQNGSLGPDAKLYAYSAHDATIAALLSTFGLYYEIFPKYATCLIIEMHRMDNSTRYLRIFHKNETDVDRLIEYSIPNCDYPCTLDKLKNDLSRYFPINWQTECGLPSNNPSFSDAATSFVLFFSTVFFAILFAFEKMKNQSLVYKNQRFSDRIPMLHNSEEEEI